MLLLLVVVVVEEMPDAALGGHNEPETETRPVFQSKPGLPAATLTSLAVEEPVAKCAEGRSMFQSNPSEVLVV